MNQWLHHSGWLGHSSLAWIIAGLGALLGYAVTHGAASILGSRLRALAARTHRSGFGIAAAVAVAIALDVLHFGTPTEQARHLRHWLQQITFALVGLQAAFWVSALIVAWLRRSTHQGTPQRGNPVMLGVLT